MRKLILSLLLCAPAWAATTITDTIYTGFPSVRFAGYLTIYAPNMETTGGATVRAWERKIRVTNGALSIALEPNDTATPAGTSYRVVYQPDAGASWTRYWTVTTSVTALKITDIEASVLPTVSTIITPAQLAASGSNGQVLTKDSTDARGMKWAAVTGGTWGSITGTLADQDDLQSALGGKLSTSGTAATASALAANPAACAAGEYVTDIAADGTLTCGAPTGGGALEYGLTICAGGCYTNETSVWKRPAPGAKTVTACVADAVTYPTGGDLIVDVLKNGTTTIFQAAGKLTFTAGATTYIEQTSMAAAATLAKGDYLIAKVTQAGATIAGDKLTVVCTVE